VKHPLRWVVVAVAVGVAALAVVLAANVGRDPEAATANPIVGKQAPDYTLTRLDGTKVTSAGLAGKTVIVNFWNSWCIPCNLELPTLKAFADAHRDDPDVVMLGIPRSDTAEAIRVAAKGDGVTWSVANDGGAKQATIDFGTTGQPETYVIGPDGVVAGAYLGQLRKGVLETMVARAQGAG
jgi:cytochrome c biogenesis protein CcmG/thiol:disulfide interchange protein DsbE